jgi:hypothetical protein
MKKQYICMSLVLATIIACSPLRALAMAAEGEPTSPLLITEVAAGTAVSASQEFIELQNISRTAIDLDAGKWRIEITSSTATTWASPFRTIALTGVLGPREVYTVASKYTVDSVPTQYLPDIAAASFSAGISATSGHVRLVYTVQVPGSTAGACADADIVADVVEWSTLKNGQPAVPSIDGRGVFTTGSGGIGSGSLDRLYNTAAYTYFDTGIDNTDFAMNSSSPGVASPLVATTATIVPDTCNIPTTPPIVPSDPPSPPPDGSGGDGVPDEPAGGDDTNPGETGPIPDQPTNTTLLPPTITELLPNPATPQTDSVDEFIELYNPNDVPFDASGFVLEVGLATKHRSTLPAGTVLAPKSWTAFYSAATGLSMANDGGQARLFDSADTVVATTEAYATAPDGQAWMYNGTAWQWTTTPTPAAANTATVLPAVIKKPSTTTTAAKKTAAVKAAATTKAAAKKAAAKTAKAPKAAKAAKTSTAFSPVAAATRNPLHTGVLAAVGVFAISYGAYEYRNDIANKFHQLRQHRATRRSNRPGAARRRNN